MQLHCAAVALPFWIGGDSEPFFLVRPKQWQRVKRKDNHNSGIFSGLRVGLCDFQNGRSRTVPKMVGFWRSGTNCAVNGVAAIKWFGFEV
jgi:hypothetical protein